MTIREYAAECRHKIVGKLTRRPDLEYKFDIETGRKVKDNSVRCYTDEAGNGYTIIVRGLFKGQVIIDTADGGLI